MASSHPIAVTKRQLAKRQQKARRRARRFLAETDAVIPWTPLLALIAVPSEGRKALGLDTMVHGVVQSSLA